MASFSQNIDNKYGIQTYQDTKNTYDWIEKAIRKGAFSGLKIKYDFLFDINSITVSCETMSEFAENAYGQSEYSFISGRIIVYLEDKNIAYISVSAISNHYGIRVSCESKAMIERVVNLLQTTSLNEAEVNDPISVTYIEQNNGVVVNGNGNAIANDHSTVTVSAESRPEPKAKQWLKAIGQNLLANGIWYVLCLAMVVLVAYIKLSNS